MLYHAFCCCSLPTHFVVGAARFVDNNSAHAMYKYVLWLLLYSALLPAELYVLLLYNTDG